jgi:hypothetical protein
MPKDVYARALAQSFSQRGAVQATVFLNLPGSSEYELELHSASCSGARVTNRALGFMRSSHREVEVRSLARLRSVTSACGRWLHLLVSPSSDRIETLLQFC